MACKHCEIKNDGESSGKAQGPPKVSKLIAPMAIERRYQTEIRKTLNVAADLVRQIIVPALPQLVADNKLLRGDELGSDELYRARKSGILELDLEPVGNVIAELYDKTRITLGQDLTDLELERLAQTISLETSGWNKQQIHRVFRQALGINLLQGEPYLAQHLQVFAINNANLIRNVSDTFIDQTQQIVFEGMAKGWRHEVISKKLLGTGKDELGKASRFHMAKTRADLIGRDQINKLNGQLNNLRQVNAGITHYFWRDSNDSRVRPSHRGFDGNRYSWKSGAPGGIHPGDEIQCRCWPEPDFSTLDIG